MLLPLRPARWLAGALLAAATVTAQPAPTPEQENFQALVGSKRLTGAPQLLREAVLRLLFESEHFAFTQTIRSGVARDGSDAVETIECYDPSQPGEAQWRLLKYRGAPPTAAETAQWRERRRQPGPDAWALEDFLDFARAVPVEEAKREVTYRVPLGRAASGLFPREEVFALVGVTRLEPVIADLSMMSRATVGNPNQVSDQRFGLGVEMLFIDKNLAPPPALLLMVGRPGVAWISPTGFREVKWSDCRRVKLYDERFGVKIGPLRTLDF